MADLPQQRIQETINEGYSLNIGGYINEAWEYFKTNAGGFVGFFLLIIGGALLVSRIPIRIGRIDLMQFGWSIVTPVLMAGFYIVAHKIRRKENFDFSNFLDGTKVGKEIWMLGLVQGAIYTLIGILTYPVSASWGASLVDTSYAPSISAFAWALALAAFVVNIYLSVSWIYSIPMVLFFKLNYWEALESSRKLVGRNFWGILGFAIVIGLLAVSGVIALVIGLLVSVPVAIIATYTSFADILKIDETEEIDILNHLVED